MRITRQAGMKKKWIQPRAYVKTNTTIMLLDAGNDGYILGAETLRRDKSGEVSAEFAVLSKWDYFESALKAFMEE